MHFSTIALPVLATLGAAQTITTYSDGNCRNRQQTVQFSRTNYFQCTNFAKSAQSVIFSRDGWQNRGFNVFDAQYCAGLTAGDPTRLGKCLKASDYGLFYFKSGHISPRNEAPPPPSSGFSGGLGSVIGPTDPVGFPSGAPVIPIAI